MNRQHHLWTIDSIEEGIARVEVDGDRVVTLPSWLLPTGVAEGDVLRVSHQRETARSVVVIDLDRVATRLAAEQSARQLASTPLDTGPGGDIVL